MYSYIGLAPQVWIVLLTVVFLIIVKLLTKVAWTYFHNKLFPWNLSSNFRIPRIRVEASPLIKQSLFLIILLCFIPITHFLSSVAIQSKKFLLQCYHLFFELIHHNWTETHLFRIECLLYRRQVKDFVFEANGLLFVDSNSFTSRNYYIAGHRYYYTCERQSEIVFIIHYVRENKKTLL